MHNVNTSNVTSAKELSLMTVGVQRVVVRAGIILVFPVSTWY
jgi:hypothetical protein